ncbi:hypothetical protein Tco_0615393 [Tanacetum coccineum]
MFHQPPGIVDPGHIQTKFIRSMIVLLMYLTTSRTNIMFVVCVIAEFKSRKYQHQWSVQFLERRRYLAIARRRLCWQMSTTEGGIRLQLLLTIVGKYYDIVKSRVECSGSGVGRRGAS